VRDDGPSLLTAGTPNATGTETGAGSHHAMSVLPAAKPFCPPALAEGGVSSARILQRFLTLLSAGLRLMLLLRRHLS
jgi:hypothetical protein